MNPEIVDTNLMATIQLSDTIKTLAASVQSLTSQVGALSFQIPNFIKFVSSHTLEAEGKALGQASAEY